WSRWLCVQSSRATPRRITKGWMLLQARHASSSIPNVAVSRCGGSRLARKALAASSTACVETPVDSTENNPGTTSPSVVMPLNGSARDRRPASPYSLNRCAPGPACCANGRRADIAGMFRIPNTLGLAVTIVSLVADGNPARALALPGDCTTGGAASSSAGRRRTHHARGLARLPSRDAVDEVRGPQRQSAAAALSGAVDAFVAGARPPHD